MAWRREMPRWEETLSFAEFKDIVGAYLYRIVNGQRCIGAGSGGNPILWGTALRIADVLAVEDEYTRDKSTRKALFDDLAREGYTKYITSFARQNAPSFDGDSARDFYRGIDLDLDDDL